MLNPDLSARADALAAQFQRRDPFRYVVIEDFFAPENAPGCSVVCNVGSAIAC
jgi:hypothetical protein